MERRDFVKTLPVVALTAAATQDSNAQAAAAKSFDAIGNEQWYQFEFLDIE